MKFVAYLGIMLLAVVLIGCGGSTIDTDHADDGVHLELPMLTPVALDGRPLRVVATTSMIGDVVAQVAGTATDLTTLMGAGQDPHAFQATPGTLVLLAEADVVFVNGWELEAALLSSLDNLPAGRVVPISAGIEPRTLGDGADDHADDGDLAHGTADPHVWFSVANLRQWTINAAIVLGTLDPTNAATFNANRDAYLAQLDDLQRDMDQQFATLPAERRKLVTNHDSLGYLADAYGFELIGTVIPSLSTAADPSAAGLADLIGKMRQEGVCTLFTESTVSTRLADAVAVELDYCPAVQVIALYTGALGPPGSGAESMIGMLRSNVAAIVNALGE